MSNLGVYNFITLDGYIADANDDKSWHVHGGEEAEYASESASNDGVLLFGPLWRGTGSVVTFPAGG